MNAGIYCYKRDANESDYVTRGVEETDELARACVYLGVRRHLFMKGNDHQAWEVILHDHTRYFLDLGSNVAGHVSWLTTNPVRRHDQIFYRVALGRRKQRAHDVYYQTVAALLKILPNEPTTPAELRKYQIDTRRPVNLLGEAARAARALQGPRPAPPGINLPPYRLKEPWREQHRKDWSGGYDGPLRLSEAEGDYPSRLTPFQ